MKQNMLKFSVIFKDTNLISMNHWLTNILNAIHTGQGYMLLLSNSCYEVFNRGDKGSCRRLFKKYRRTKSMGDNLGGSCWSGDWFVPNNPSYRKVTIQMLSNTVAEIQGFSIMLKKYTISKKSWKTCSKFSKTNSTKIIQIRSTSWKRRMYNPFKESSTMPVYLFILNHCITSSMYAVLWFLCAKKWLVW